MRIQKTCNKCQRSYRGYQNTITSCCSLCRKTGCNESVKVVGSKQRSLRRCGTCGEPFWGRKRIGQAYCSLKCYKPVGASPERMKRIGEVPRKPYRFGTCDYCGKPYAKRSAGRAIGSIRNFCSKNCSDYAATKRRDQRRAGNGIPDRIPSIRELFSRDKGVCWLCNKKVNLGLPARHPKSATRDHVIPVCKGGGESLDNLALAHFGCNARKHDKIVSLF